MLPDEFKNNLKKKSKDQLIKIIEQDREKIYTYEGFLHDLNMFAGIVMDGEAVGELIGNACSWSYAHRVGNGMLSDKEQDACVRERFLKLRDTPETDKRNKERQKKRDERKKEKQDEEKI